MEIRYMTREDDPFEISNIYEESWKYAYQNIIPQDFLDSIPVGKWADRVTAEGIYSLVLTKESVLIGTASFCRSRWQEYSGCGEIISIYLLPEYIGKGCGGPLLNACLDELKKMGFKRILLRVLEDNHRARRFYEKCGFTFSGDCQTEQIGGKTLRELMYVYEVPQHTVQAEKGKTDSVDTPAV